MGALLAQNEGPWEFARLAAAAGLS
jgi:hypothetical protein